MVRFVSYNMVRKSVGVKSVHAKSVNVQEAKTHLSSLLDQVENGEVIVLCRYNEPIAEIRAIRKPRAEKRKFGKYDGFGVSPSFFDPLPDDVLEAFGEK